MSKENHFVYNPSTVDIGRSKFIMNSFWKGAIHHGDLVPVEVTRVMPGDSAKYNLSVFIRTATPPIAPFMDTIKLHFAAFFVPDRLVWNITKEFYGEKTEGYGIQSEVLAPRSTSFGMTITSSNAGGTYAYSLAAYLGLVRQGSVTNPSPIALNPLRSILQCYNDWFRSENFDAPYLWDHNETGDGDRPIATLGGTALYGPMALPKVLKQLDRFTSCLPWAQKGSPVLLPLGSTAPLVGIGTGGMNLDSVKYTDVGAVSGNPSVELQFNHGTAQTAFLGFGTGAAVTTNDTEAVAGQFFADLSSATAASINQLRLAFATQKYLEQLARSGSKYREYIKGMFGVNIGDTTAQMAEYLGGMTVELNIDQVLQTTGFSAGSSSTLGAPGATSTSAASNYLFTKSFAEPGYLVIFAYTKHTRTYGQGIDEIYQKHEILEEYNPKFANIGEQAIKKSNIYFTGDKSDDDTRLGFQEAWSEYRYKKDMVVGLMAPSNSSSYNFWTLAENFASAPVLNADFLHEDRTNVARCLTGGTSAPDYFLDIKFNRVFVRPMPLYSIPGLIDHH